MPDPYRSKRRTTGVGARPQSRRRAQGRPAFPAPTTARRTTVDRPPVDASVGGRRPFTAPERDPALGSNNAPLEPDAVNDLGALSSGEPVTDDEPVADADAGVVDAQPGRCSSACDEGHTYEAPCVMAGAPVGEALEHGLADGLTEAAESIGDQARQAVTDAESAARAAAELEPDEDGPAYTTDDVPTKADDVIAWLASADGPGDAADRARVILEAERARKGRARVTVVEAATEALGAG